MSRFRVCSLPFAGWGIVFLFFPRFTNEFAGVGYAGSSHAQDWTQIVGLFSFAFAVLLNEAHRTINVAVRRVVARGVVTLTLPCALLMTYWQLLPDRQWIRMDIVNVLILYAISYSMLLASDVSPFRPKDYTGTILSHGTTKHSESRPMPNEEL